LLTPKSAEELGLSAGIPVAGGGADAPLAALAAGVVRPDQMALTISTGSQVIVPASDFRPDRGARVHTWRNVLAGDGSGAPFYHMGATMVSGLAMRWLRDEIFVLDCESGYAEMTSDADATPPGAGGLLFLPYLAGERTPYMNPNARGVFLGLTAGHGRGNLTRAVMEGAVFALLDAFAVLQELGAQPSAAVLCGGGARSVLWRQIVADCFGIEVKPLLTVEQSALGAAIMAGAAIGCFYPAEAARDWAEYGPPVESIAENVPRYAELHAIFRDAYRANVKAFDDLSRIAVSPNS
jgi:xylulokinase